MVTCIRALPFLLTCLLLSAPAWALTVTVATDSGVESALDRDDFGCIDGDRDTYGCESDGSVLLDPSVGWELSEWDLFLDPDPIVIQQFSFQNISNVVQTFTVTTLIPVVNAFTATRIGGSMGGSITDANGNNLGGLTTDGQALYTALIDGVPVATLHDDPFQLNFAFAGNSPSIPSVSFGLPGLTVIGPGIDIGDFIGIQHKFTLSPGDTIAVTSVFIVENIPEPSTAILLGGGLTALLAASRRLRPIG